MRLCPTLIVFGSCAISYHSSPKNRKNIILIQGLVSYDLHKHVHKSTQNVQPVMFWDLPSCSSDRIFILMNYVGVSFQSFLQSAKLH